MTLIVTDGLVIGFEPYIGDDTVATLFILISTVSAVICTYFVGKFGQKKGAKKTFYLVGSLWTISLILFLFGILISILFYQYVNQRS